MILWPQIDPARKKRLEESFIRHAALAELHRWCQARKPGAHGVRSHSLDVMPDGRVAVTAELDRYDVDGTVRIATVGFKAEMTLDGSLPRFARTEISSAEDGEGGAFDDPYLRNRLLSLVHYFTSLVENPARDPEPFREVLAEGFALHYVEPPISSLPMLDDWVTGRLASVVASNHVIHDVSFEPAGADEYIVTVVMESEALFPDGSGIISKNRQSWSVVDDVSERFARISEVRIERDDVHRFDLPEAD
jgi:hypothetical protein